MEKRERQSNIELLRILTMCGVIVLHYNNPTMGGGLAYAQGVNLYILYFLESVFACAVDLFVLITGYFMCEKQNRTFHKPLELLLQVILFNEVFYFISSIFHRETPSIKHVVGRLLPANWFVILYITLYFISPFLNLAIDELEHKGILKKFVIISILLFSIYPTFVDVLGEITHRNYIGLSSVGMYGSQWGYSIVNFSLMYLVGAYLRKNQVAGSVNKHVMLFFIMAIVLVIWAIINDMTGFATERSAWEYCNPLVIFMAIAGFSIFQKIDIGCKQWINGLARASFTVYLLHARFLKYLLIHRFVVSKPWIMVLHIVISTVLIYSVCAVVSVLYHKIMSHGLNALYQKYPILERNIYSIE